MISRSTNHFSEKIISELRTRIIGRKIYHFKTIDSTNDFARELTTEDVEEGTIVVSDVQLSGRGRKNRAWSSPEGGLWFSVVLYPNISPQQGMLVTMNASISVAQAIKKVTNLNPEIKWPNDVLIDGKKVCGILTENDATKLKINYSIVGIGINVNNEIENNLKNIAISLKQKIGRQISNIELLRSILIFFDQNYRKMNSGDFETNRKLWFSFTNIVGKKVRVKDGEEIVGTFKDIDKNGYLILETSEGLTKIITGEIDIL